MFVELLVMVMDQFDDQDRWSVERGEGGYKGVEDRSGWDSAREN